MQSEFCATDTFTFIKDIQDADFSGMFMVSYDVISLSKDIPFFIIFSCI